MVLVVVPAREGKEAYLIWDSGSSFLLLHTPEEENNFPFDTSKSFLELFHLVLGSLQPQPLNINLCHILYMLMQQFNLLSFKLLTEFY